MGLNPGGSHLRKVGLIQEALAMGLDGHGSVCHVGCQPWATFKVLELERETWVEEAKPSQASWSRHNVPVREARMVGIGSSDSGA